MKTYKYIGLLFLSLAFVSCEVNNELAAIPEEEIPEVALNTGSADFSRYVSIGASFTAGFTDNALFIAGQENSFPNILSKKFAMGGGGEFNQPLMNDNNGGLLFGGMLDPNGGFRQRLYFNGAGPVPVPGMPTTEFSSVLSGPFNNMGVPGAKSYHFVAPGYGSVANVSLGLANPYYARFASGASATVLEDAVGQNPTFFTVSEIGGNDVLGYALSGGTGVDQTGNPDVTTYGTWDITDPDVFASVFSNMIAALTAGNAKGVVANIPYIVNFAHFTTVPYNPIPMDAATAGAVNAAYMPYNEGIKAAFAALVGLNAITQEAADLEIAKRTISFAAGQNAVVIVDEDLTDLEALNPNFAGLKQWRQATAEDLLVLTGSSFIGTLADPNNPATVNGVGVPLEDKWVLTPEEQAAVKTATDAYNETIVAVVQGNPNVFLVDFQELLEEASFSGLAFDDFVMTTNLVTGGLIGLDGIHLTARGYAFLANEILEIIDLNFGANFREATNGLAKAVNYPTNYSPDM